MRRVLIFIFATSLLFASAAVLEAQSLSGSVVFSEAGFPAADSAGLSPEQMQKMLPGAQLASAQQLANLLNATSTRLLVLPYGSAFPEAAWPDIYRFLRRGGNLLVLGGRPFTRSAYRDDGGWKLRDYSVRFTRPLMIDQYQATSGSEGLEFQANPDVTVQLPRFAWKRAYSPVIRLSAVDLYARGGSAGSIDARLDALAWGMKDGRKLAAPVIQVDHLRNGFDGGRWIFLSAELTPEFYGTAQAEELVRTLAESAMSSLEFTVRPVLPLYLPGEPAELEVLWRLTPPPKQPLTVQLTTFSQSEPSHRTQTTVSLPVSQPVVLRPPNSKGLWIVEAKLLESESVRAIYHSAFWIRDEAFLTSGPRLTVNRDFFELDGQPLAVVGTTYMSSEVQRLYFEHPNVYVWDHDLEQIHKAGLNMIRTGWWTGWDKFCDENGRPYERTLRTLEAFLMTARKNGLPVQFNFFAFLPEVLGGGNPYLDPDAVRKQETLVATVAGRFHSVPYLAWDLINEPSISHHLWTMRPSGDPIELEKWNQWLNQRYPDRAALAAAWNVPAAALDGAVPLPKELEFTERGVYRGNNSLKVYDFFLFAQHTFSNWVQIMHDAVRGTGSRQLITVGQDEGGIQDRLSPAFWGRLVDFTTNHSWWQNDFLLWDSLLAKQPGQPLLIQETGLQRELDLDEIARRSPESEAALLERKMAISFIQGSGAIEWLWHTNSYMIEGNETPIGAIRPDGTEKPEATVMRNFAEFAKSLHQLLRDPQQPAIAIITSQAAHFSVRAELQLEAQRKAVRALAYYDRFAAYAIAENQIEKLGSPRLAILPSPQALTETAWLSLLNYVTEGGNLLITGPVDRDEHWHATMRAGEMKLDAHAEPLTYHNGEVRLGDRVIPLSFEQQKQDLLESLRFSDGSTFKEVSYGKGRIFWAAYPIELAEGAQATADLYGYVCGRIGIPSAYELKSPLPPGVLVYPVVLGDSILYVLASESADDTQVDLLDVLSGVRLTLKLPAQHAALALIGKRQRAVVAKYGF
jgi:hypothetical protein